MVAGTASLVAVAQTGSGIFRFVDLCMRLRCRDTPLGHVVGPLRQDAGGVAVRRFLARLLVDKAQRDGIAGAVADIFNGRSALGFHPPGPAPITQCENHRPERLASLGGVIFIARRVRLVGLTGEQPLRRKLVQSVGEDVGRDPQRSHEFIEPAQPHQQISQDQETPAVTSDRHGRRDWALGAFIRFRSGAYFLPTHLFAGAWSPRLPVLFPHADSLATFVTQVDSAAEHSSSATLQIGNLQKTSN